MHLPAHDKRLMGCFCNGLKAQSFKTNEAKEMQKGETKQITKVESMEASAEMFCMAEVDKT